MFDSVCLEETRTLNQTALCVRFEKYVLFFFVFFNYFVFCLFGQIRAQDEKHLWYSQPLKIIEINPNSSTTTTSRLKQMLRFSNVQWHWSVLQMAVLLHCFTWALFLFQKICNNSYSCCIPTGHVHQINIWRSARNHRDDRGCKYKPLRVHLCRLLLHGSSTCSVICRVRWLYHRKPCHGGVTEQLLMTLCLPISPWRTAVRKSTLEMKSFRSIIRQWWAHVFFALRLFFFHIWCLNLHMFLFLCKYLFNSHTHTHT